MHPVALSGDLGHQNNASFLEKVKVRFPEKVAYFEKQQADRKAKVAQSGEFISNDSYCPETPDWCPVVQENKAARKAVAA
jgi:hypothetical protein